jgi:hypothetical protein
VKRDRAAVEEVGMVARMRQQPRRRVTLPAAVFGAVALLVGTGSTAFASSGAATEQRFVPNVIGQFNATSRRPEALAFKRGSSPEATLCKHYQGIARKDGPDGTPYVFMTKSGNVPDSAFCAGDHGNGWLIVARLGSREKTGERLRSNLWPSGLLPATDLGDDVAVTAIPLNGENGWPRYRHPGGMQLLGDVLAIGVENPAFISHPRAIVLFVDVSDPENPRPLSEFVPPDLDGPANAEFGADPVGLTAIKTEQGTCCRYLMIVAGGPANREVRFFLSRPGPEADATTTDLKSTELDWDPAGRYSEAAIETCLGADWPTGGGPQHQMLNFVRQGDLDGPLFLVGGRNATDFFGAPFGDDFIDLYQVNLAGGVPTLTCPLTHVSTRQMGPTGHANYSDVSNFATASGVYVSPSGELIVYASKHTSTAGGVFFGEYRHRDMVRADSPTLRPTASVDGPFAVDEGSSLQLTGQGGPPITQAWIQLFTETGAVHRVSTFFNFQGWLPVNYPDRDADAFDELDRFGFGALYDWSELFSSWRWFAPPGCTISANDFPIRSLDWPGEDTVLLRGTGNVEVETDLSDLPVYRPVDTPWAVSPVPAEVTAENLYFDEELGGVTFWHEGFDNSVINDCEEYYNAPIGISWDLDGDGSYEVGGTSATFSASSLDGPSTATVHARAQHSTDTSAIGTGAPTPVPIEVRNVAPSVGAITAAGAVAIGTPISTSASFTDPGTADTHTAVWDWGDGNTSAGVVTESNGSGTATGSHAYTTPGFYTVTVTVKDDDLGSDESQLQNLVVFDPDRSLSVNAKITSPAGAYLANPLTSGPAYSTAGARYKSGMSIPSGSATFQFSAASFYFNAGSLEWLVVELAHHRAYLQGTGSVNGIRGYSFLLSVVDGSPDRYRLKVWETATPGNVVYDSQAGAPITAPATTPLAVGSVVLG